MAKKKPINRIHMAEDEAKLGKVSQEWSTLNVVSTTIMQLSAKWENAIMW